MNTCVVTKNGNSATVTLPASWRKRHGIKIGDVLDVSVSGDASITFTARSQDRSAALDNLIYLLESAPECELVGDGSPESDKAILGERYA